MIDKDALRKLIRDSINSIGFEELRKHKKNTISNGQPKKHDISEDDIDDVLFYGGKRPEILSKKQIITIQESSAENIKLTSTEVKGFENSFSQLIQSVSNATVTFNKQKNGYSIIAYKRPDGMEVLASGTINLGRNGKITWSYSILNGATINGQNFKLTQGNKYLFEQLADNYDDFQKNWRARLSLPNNENNEDVV